MCKLPIYPDENWNDIKDQFEDVLNQVDAYGVDSLTEQEQVLYENGVHADCFFELE